SLKERPISPTNSGVIGPQSQAPGSVSMTSLPSPQTNLGSPMSVVAGVGPTQTPQALINQQGPTPQVSAGAVYRPNQNQFLICPHEAKLDPFPDLLLHRKILEVLVIEPETLVSVARNS
ncbi:unnamed protein product, partial [Timema podura]|nr:unnamed protein product [Timema podura]